MAPEISIFLACLLASGFFSGSETALLSASRLKLRRMAGEGDARAARILDLVGDPRRLLAGILVGNNIANALAVSTATVLFVGLFGETRGAFAATAVSTVLLVLFSEFLPKTAAALHPIRFARRSARPVRWALALLAPLVWPLEKLTRPLGAALGSRRERFGIAELRVAVSEGVRSGEVDDEMARMLRRGLSLRSKSAGDILVPRVDVAGVDAGADFEQCLEAFRREQYSRLLVMEETPDRDLGYLAIKDLTLLPEAEREGWTARDGSREALRVPESKPLPELLAMMRRSGTHFAVVKDEYGGTEGIVTLEDLIEELVGEIRDEHDSDEIDPISQVAEAAWLLRGDVSLKTLNERFGVELPLDEARTVGGLVAEILGRVPAKGDRVEAGRARLEVLKTEDNRVLRIMLTRA